MTTENDVFRARLLNWSRVYRPRYIRSESPLAKVLRMLRRQAGVFEDDLELREPPDVLDADFIDRCWRYLDRRNQKILKVEYLTPQAEDFESDADAIKARHRKAKLCDLWLRNYDLAVRAAECRFRSVVERIEISGFPAL